MVPVFAMYGRDPISEKGYKDAVELTISHKVLKTRLNLQDEIR